MNWPVKANLFAAVINVGVVVRDCVFGPPDVWTVVNIVCAAANIAVAVLCWERR
jgi:hypothetical protein